MGLPEGMEIVAARLIADGRAHQSALGIRDGNTDSWQNRSRGIPYRARNGSRETLPKQRAIRERDYYQNSCWRILLLTINPPFF